MAFVIFIIGLVEGIFLNIIINKICYKFFNDNTKPLCFTTSLISSVLFLILFLKIGLNIIFLKGLVLISILIVVSFVDLKHQIIPDRLSIFALVLGLAFYFAGDNSLLSTILGMLAGGGILLLLAFIPNAIGGGDIKFMFAIGSFLGFTKTLWALLLAFALSSVIGILLIIFKKKEPKDYIPLGPFLALGSFSAFIIF